MKTIQETRLVRLVLLSYWELTETLESQKDIASQWQPMASIHLKETLTHIDTIIYTENTIHALFYHRIPQQFWVAQRNMQLSSFTIDFGKGCLNGNKIMGYSVSLQLHELGTKKCQGPNTVCKETYFCPIHKTRMYLIKVRAHDLPHLVLHDTE